MLNIILLFLTSLIYADPIRIINNEGLTNLELARLKNDYEEEAKIEDLIYKEFGNSIPLYILIPTFNNIEYYQKNLESIVSQNYQKYKVIIIDDNSTDGTGLKIEEFIKSRNIQDRFILIKNNERKLLLKNFIHAIKGYCPKKSIVISLDGDDWLYGNNVLDEIIEAYTKEKIWLTYGNPLFLTENKICSEVLGSYWGKNLPNEFYEHGYMRKNKIWFFHHLRSFWAWLFLKINEDDFKDKNGEFYTAAPDVAWFMPMIEMSGPDRVKCFNSEQSVYNNSTNYNEIKIFKVDMIVQIFDDIMQKKPYEILNFD
jgi:glycosyltransferase involved in cell wall biosynthesis